MQRVPGSDAAVAFPQAIQRRRASSAWRAGCIFALLGQACMPQEVAVAVAPQEPVPASDPFLATTPVERYLLRNGLTVILNEDHSVPLVAVRVVYPVGWAHDPPERLGLSHLVEHLLFHGSRNVPAGQLVERLHAGGAGAVNGFVDPDVTHLFELVPANQLALALWLESDRMAFGLERLSPADVERQAVILRRELAMSADQGPERLVGERINRQLFGPGHPYHASPSVSSHLDTVTLDEVQAFYRARYGPTGATLVLSGDFDVAEAKRIVGHYFADLPPSPPPVALRPAEATLAAPSVIRVEAAQARPSVTVAWATPALFAPFDAELDIVARYLNASLPCAASDTRIASSAQARQASRKLASTFSIRLSLQPSASPETALQAIDEALDALRTSVMSRKQVRHLAMSWLFELYVSHDDLIQRTFLISSSQQGVGNPHFLGANIPRYRGATPSSVADAVARYLAPERRVTAFVTPHPDAPALGRVVSP